MDGSTAMRPRNVNISRLLINRNFGLLWGGQAISYIGDFVFDTTLLLWVATKLGAGQSWTPLAVTGVLLAVSVPEVVIGPMAGVFVDRWDKRRTMLIMDALRAVLILSLLPLAGVLPFLHAERLPVLVRLGDVYLVVFLATVCAQFFSPSRTALIGDIVDDANRPRAAGMSQSVMALSVIIGPPIAGPLFFGVGATWALMLNALSFVASFVAILAVRAPKSARSVAPGEKGNVVRELVQGLRFYAGNRILMTLLVGGVIVMLGAGSLNALDYFFVVQNLHASPSWYGWLSAAQGAGALGGAVLAAVFAQRIGVARLFWMSVIAISVAILVYSRLSSFGAALGVIFLTGAPGAAVNVAVQPLLLRAAPRELIGRVSGVLMPAMSVTAILSMVLAGYLLSTVMRTFHASLLGLTFGPVDTIFTVAGLFCLAGGIYCMINLRKAEEEAPPQAPEEEAPSPATEQQPAGHGVA